jgi:hypothetical protein
MKHLIKFGVLAFVGLGAACGGDGGGGDNQVDTGLPETQPLSELTPAQVTNACNSVETTLEARFGGDRLTRLACELFGAAVSDDPAACRDVADDCIANPPAGLDETMMGDLSEATDLGCTEGSSFEGCELTIADFESCINDALVQVDQFFSELGCSNAASVTLATDPSMMMGPPPEQPQSCTRLETECPESTFPNDEPR